MVMGASPRMRSDSAKLEMILDVISLMTLGGLG